MVEKKQDKICHYELKHKFLKKIKMAKNLCSYKIVVTKRCTGNM